MEPHLPREFVRRLYCILPMVFLLKVDALADDFKSVLQPLFADKCVHCHGEEDANAGIRFNELTSRQALVDNPTLILKTLEAIDSGAMPPDGESPLPEALRTQVANTLKTMLAESAREATPVQSPLQRFNRFQYNNTVRDLFRLDRNVFALPEKLMTRQDSYLHRSANDSLPSQMPDTVNVVSEALSPRPGLSGVKAFPKDLRAEHGFDNQASQLTLSPLVLDAFLRLSVSIVESPDFNEHTVGIWNDFFREPAADADRNAEVQTRLARFLRIAFRGPVDDETLARYSDYAIGRINNGMSFTDGMKKVASAALSSPLFLYRSASTDPSQQQLVLASRLSYFLWGSCPDEELLALAEDGTLTQPEVLKNTFNRMLVDPKVERFLDSFPTQWMQLENLMAATPDPNINKYFSFDPKAPASLQMVLEPLLLFDAVFIEDRPISELIAPEFCYQSEFLRTWYNSELKPTPVDTQAIMAQNQRYGMRRREILEQIENATSKLDLLLEPVRKALLEKRVTDEAAVPSGGDLRPFAAWDFNGNLKDSIGNLDLTAHGDIQFRDGMVVLDKSYLQSAPLSVDFKAKSLEVRFRLPNLDQPGGGLMGIQGAGDFFDTIVIGERKSRHWISGSNGFRRTKDFPNSIEETVTDDILHLVMVYEEDGTTALYRNGQPYGEPFHKGQAVFKAEKSSVIFGLRHLPAGGNRFLTVNIDQAQLYDRALTQVEVGAAASGQGSFVSDAQLTAALTPQQKQQKARLTATISNAQADLKAVPNNVDVGEALQAAEREFENDLKAKLRSTEFRRLPVSDARYGGIITNAAMLSMTSGPGRTHPVARGVWVIEVIFNNPPPPPPNDVPPLDEDSGAKDLTIREQFAAHRENPSCAGCHTKLDPLGFALENFDITGRWRDNYDNGRVVDSSGTLLRKYPFDSVIQFKNTVAGEKRRFAKAFVEHLLRFALARELRPVDFTTIDAIVNRTESEGFRMKSLIREVVLCETFLSEL